ncbi:MAG TPA: L-threonylcarbamoyladenylate synthase [Chthonomonadales bacterium]|nr:L-threonylcarbamoyladenylate synthase [Chthonomonadales bacterium]
MRTETLALSADSPDDEVIARAAAVIRAGGLVAFPTETVYGLGANALDEAAVSRVFQAKGRPAGNPLIVHTADAASARCLTAGWPEKAQQLAEAFWPGPLTLVLPRSEIVPPIVTAGGPTVALRAPAHPVAVALIRAAGVPIAAPSANRSTAVSPTTGAHVLKGLCSRIDLVLDAGPTPGGIESTVLDLTEAPPVLLRPGAVTPSRIEQVIGPIMRFPSYLTEGPARSPGTSSRHYAPSIPLTLSNRPTAVLRQLLQRGKRPGWLRFPHQQEVAGVVSIVMPGNAADYAARLYAALHTLEDSGVTSCVVSVPPGEEAWLAILDRLRRAAQAR